MADKKLKKQLEGLFSDLADSPRTSEGSGSDGVDAERPDVYQLESLFSGLRDSFKAGGPSSESVVEVGPPRVDFPAKSKIRDQRLLADSLVLEGKVVRAADRAPRTANYDDVVALLKSTQTHKRRQALENLAQMQQGEWMIDPLLHAATDNDLEITRLALLTLLQMRDAVNKRVLVLAQQRSTPLHPGSTIYVSCLLDQPFVYVPPGPFLMGSDPTVDEMADANEQPQHEVSLPGFWISRYPLTTARFQTFLTESGYHLRHGGREYDQEDYPVADVSWYDALAYCRWLAQRSGLHVTLPSEAEWEKAARGPDGRRFPWGNHPPTTGLCNFGQLTAVGHFSPQGDSFFGCADMAGNVWEWTRSTFKSYPYDPRDGREDLEGEDMRVARGVTFGDSDRFTRCAFRYRLQPILHLPDLGFRVVVSLD